jgi:hypothetical protein
MGQQRSYPICACCQCEVRTYGTVLIGTGEETEKVQLCITCACLKIEHFCDLLHVDEARRYLTRF